MTAPRRRRAAVKFVAVLALAAAVTPAVSVSAQAGVEGPGLLAADAFADGAARPLFEAAQANWAAVDESVLRYQAVIQQRIAAALRAPLKDRILYRSETAVRAFWDHEYESVVQVLGTHSQYPGRATARSNGDLDWLDDLPFDEPFDPGGDRLFFGSPTGDDEDSDPDDAEEADFELAHPLAEGADTLYRYASGDTLTVAFADGRSLRTVQLDVIPREADARRISGTLWIEPGSGALVRAVYRLSRRFDAVRDVPEMQEEEEEGSFRWIPGVLKPWTFDLSMIAIDYSLWNFEVWLPLSMRLEGEARAGIVRFPVTMEVGYRMESVTTRFDLARTEGARDRRESLPAEDAGLVERHFETRAEAMDFVARLLSEESGIEYESVEDEEFAEERDASMIVPRDRSRVSSHPELPAPVWEDAVGFPSDEQIKEYFETLADLPRPPLRETPWALAWGWNGPGLVRYNRVEGLAGGAAFLIRLSPSYSLHARGFLGVSDLDPKVRLDVERETIRRRLTLGLYRELVSAIPRAGHLESGNSLRALFTGRDEGEYYRALGTDLTWRPPEAARQSFEVRTYVERHERVDGRTGFALFHMLDDEWSFRPNLEADEGVEAGAEVRFAPWWGGDPHHIQVGLELYAQAARFRPLGGEESWSEYGRAAATARAALPLVSDRWRLGLELAGGTTMGDDATAQRAWFLGGVRTLRGHAPSVVWGPSFLRGQADVARTFDVGALRLFVDGGWAGRVGTTYGATVKENQEVLYSIGVGGSLLDGLIRADVAYGLNGPGREFGIFFYFDSLL